MLAELLLRWPLIRQLKSGSDGTGVDSMSDRTRKLRPKNDGAEVAHHRLQLRVRKLQASEVGDPANLVGTQRHARRLKDIKQNDTVRFATPNGDVLYRVSMTKIVKPTEVDVLENQAKDMITLVTCYPFGRGPGSPQRYVVRASPVGRESGSPPEWQD